MRSTKSMGIKALGAAAGIALCASGPTARASDDFAKFLSNTGTILYLAGGTARPLLTDGKLGTRRALRTADSLVVSELFSEGLKGLTRVKRPDSNEHDSFPSGHAAAAFSVATMEAQFHPREAPYWFTGAALIAYSRVKLNRHTPLDVIAGALLGYGTARLELSSRRGILIAPFIRPESRTVGANVSFRY